MRSAILATFLLFPGLLPVEITKEEKFAQVVGALTDPVKLATLTEKRAASPRLRKTCYWLEHGRRKPGIKREALLDAAQEANQSDGTARAKLLKESLLRNLVILERLGWLGAAGTAKLRTGNAPTITKGPYKGGRVMLRVAILIAK